MAVTVSTLSRLIDTSVVISILFGLGMNAHALPLPLHFV